LPPEHNWYEDEKGRVYRGTTGATSRVYFPEPVHDWNGCKCTKCSAERQHDWSKDCESCARCGKARSDIHDWSGCKCTKCGKTRDEGHDWSKDCERCARCGKAQTGIHDWSGCKCTKCGQIRILLRCEDCGAEFIPGENAACITSEELASMFPVMIGSMPRSLMIGPAKDMDRERVRKDRETILILGPSRGWDCEKCHHHNHWRV
jgi:hypothetical protein